MKILSLKSFASIVFGMLASLALMTSCTTDDVVAEVVDPDADATVAFDFTSETEINTLGIATPGAGAGSNLAASTQKNGVVIEVANAEGANPVRVWATNSGVLDLRIYNGDALTIKAPEGKVIKKISWTTANESTVDSWATNNGTVEGGVWKGSQAKAVKLTATGTTRINVLSVVYGNQEGDNVGPEPEENIDPTPEPEPEPEPTPDPTPEPTPDPTPQVPETATVSFDFTSAAFINGLGIATPANGAGSNLTAPLTVDNVTFGFANAEGANPVRVWATNSGVLDLRIYSGDAISVTAPEGRVISALSWTSANAGSIDSWSTDNGKVEGGAWSGEATQTIKLTATGTTRINVLTVTYSTPGK